MQVLSHFRQKWSRDLGTQVYTHSDKALYTKRHTRSVNNQDSLSSSSSTPSSSHCCTASLLWYLSTAPVEKALDPIPTSIDLKFKNHINRTKISSSCNCQWFNQTIPPESHTLSALAVNNSARYLPASDSTHVSINYQHQRTLVIDWVRSAPMKHRD